MQNKKKYMCATCIYRTDDKDFLSLPKTAHECHEDFGADNENLCAGSMGPRGTYVGPLHNSVMWDIPIKDEILQLARSKWKKIA